MKIHELKIFNEYFEALKEGSKTFEIRYNDRDYKVNDILYLKEVTTNAILTGREIKVRITYILNNQTYLQPGYVCLGLVITAVKRYSY